MGPLKSLAAGPGHALGLRQGVLTPVILRQPKSQARAAEQTATFDVSVWSHRQPSYQWQFGGEDIAGATAASM